MISFNMFNRAPKSHEILIFVSKKTLNNAVMPQSLIIRVVLVVIGIGAMGAVGALDPPGLEYFLNIVM